MKRNNQVVRKTGMGTALVLAAMISLAGCSSQAKGRCDYCGQTKPLYEVTLTGEASALGFNLSHSGTLDLCKDCTKQTEREAKDTGKQFGVSINVSSQKKKK